MAASRLLQLSPPFFLRASKTKPLPLRPSLFPLSNLRPFTVIPPSRLQSFTTDAAASVDGPLAVAEEVPTPAHPWPEWDRFVEKLKSKGYFERPASAGTAEDDEGDGGSATAADAKMQLNLLKNGCLKFARERFDILSSLPKEDIRSIVECGCPNLFRKSVNSAKRLRAFLQLDEGDVCSACNLRGSCDKAYIIQHEEGGARTVDVVRILLSYAVNPVNISGGENPSIKENVQESARKLLSQLIELSDTTIDPSLPEPAVSTPARKEPSQKIGGRNKHPPNAEMKRGDWLCPNCNFLNFARNLRCLECKADGPKRVEFGGAEMKFGDWTCPQCQFMNFARNRKCFRCREQRPKRELNPGDWECPSCDFINFRRNRVCLKCNCNCPEDESSRFEDRLWRRPKNNSMKFGDDEDEIDEDEDDDILPLHEGEKFVVSKRATLSERRLTSARRSNPG
ncbi:zinc finger protein VAR3, chloroplastic [Elaeis guineensis]|uniref:Zinc finger protein VAR3, chloroplastic n=1 Tax=Elaeis guineensis var. tenera TaxID=51953 RepID=A0A6I9QW20_ELAGV|nr:zinc finger protein VAR3, chloroplastic [Elaeis guineensis]